jgi:hypothetical protein
MADAVGTTAFTWTGGNQLAGEQGPWTDDLVTYTYANRLPNTMSVAAPNSASWLQSYVWDNSSRLTNITTAAGVFPYTYTGGSDQVARLDQPGDPYGQIHNYDGLGRVNSIWWNNLLLAKMAKAQIGSQTRRSHASNLSDPERSIHQRRERPFSEKARCSCDINCLGTETCED